MKKLLFAGLFVCTATMLNAQESVFTYGMEMQGLPPEAAAMMGNMEMKVWVKGDKSRAETTTAFSSTIVISDQKTKETVTCMDMMGQKYMIKDKIKESETSEKPDVKIKKLGDKKIIAGYNCTNAEVTFKSKKDNQEVTTIVWYTPDIKSTYTGEFKGLEGVPMEYEFNNNGQKIKFTCKSYSKESVPDSKFEIPSGYTETTREELQKNMGGMGK